MKTSIDILAGLVAVKELEIKMLKERVAQLNEQIRILYQENQQLYAVLSQQQTKESHIGFRKEQK